MLLEVENLRSLQLRYYSNSEWEDNWKKLKDAYNLSNNIWFNEQYATRHKWADTFLRGHFFGGARATGICEFMNAFIKKDLEKGLPLWMFLRHCDNGVAALRYNEMAENYKTNMTDPCPKLTSMPNIEEQAASIFTRKVFNLVKAEIKRGDKYSCSKSEIVPNYDLFQHPNEFGIILCYQISKSIHQGYECDVNIGRRPTKYDKQ
ncbi:hypothetical protein CsatB_001075 [Cannabis sativa]